MSIRCDLDVARFYVAVQNGRPAGMQVTERIADRRADLDNVILHERPHTFRALPQVFAADEIHHKVLPLLRNNKMIRNTRQVGMPQVRQDHRFEAELAGIFFSGEQVLFNRHFHAKVFINGAVNRSHSPLSEIFDNSIAFVK